MKKRHDPSLWVMLLLAWGPFGADGLAQCEHVYRQFLREPGSVAHGSGLDMDGGVLAVGDELASSLEGAVYLYAFDGAKWELTKELRPSTPVALSLFGDDLDLQGDRIVVGAPFGGPANAGTAHVFLRSGGRWREEQELAAPGGSSLDNFGYEVAIDGAVLVVGAPQEAGGFPGAGAAYVYRFNGASWQLDQRLAASDESTSAFFGQAVDISGDRILVGAPRADQAYVFEYDGAAWQEVEIIHSPDSVFGAHGESVALDGDRAVVGAPVESVAGIPSGAVFVYQRDASGWNRTGILTAADRAGGDRFGVDVALDADQIVVGAADHHHSGDWTGTFLFELQAGAWVEQVELSHPGIKVAIEGEWIAAGDPGLNGAMTFSSGGLGFYVLPDDVQGGDLIDLWATGGLRSSPFLLIISSVNGIPTSRVAGIYSFRSFGYWYLLDVAVPPSISGNSIGMKVIGFTDCGPIGISNEDTLLVR